MSAPKALEAVRGRDRRYFYMRRLALVPPNPHQWRYYACIGVLPMAWHATLSTMDCGGDVGKATAMTLAK